MHEPILQDRYKHGLIASLLTMAYLQVKDILLHAEKLRTFLRGFAERHQRKASNDLLAGLFQDVKEHEKQLERCLDEFQSDDSSVSLETWIQYPGDDELEQTMTSLSAVAEQADEEVLKQLLIAEEALLRVYKQAQEQTSAQQLQELFETLIEIQDHHLRNIANCASEYGQMRHS